MAGSPQERPLRTQEQGPGFIKTIDRTGRVGILADDTWAVGWEQPGRKLVWHRHGDVWRVLRQNERVTQGFLGVPIVGEGQEARSDPTLGVSLPELQSVLLISGEIQKGQQLAQDVATLMSLSINQRTPASEITARLDHLRKGLGPVKNAFKVLGKGKLTEAIEAQTILQKHLATTKAFEAFTNRAGEGMSIVGSLMGRASTILEWVDEQEREFRRLKDKVGAMLIEIKNGPVSNQTQELWQFGLFGSNSTLARVLAIRGNPYAELTKRQELTDLTKLRGTMETLPLSPDGIKVVEKRCGAAYLVLHNATMGWQDREASGAYERYRTKK